MAKVLLYEKLVIAMLCLVAGCLMAHLDKPWIALVWGVGVGTNLMLWLVQMRDA